MKLAAWRAPLAVAAALIFVAPGAATSGGRVGRIATEVSAFGRRAALGLEGGLEAFADAEADADSQTASEVAARAAVTAELAANATAQAGSGPSTLKEYCAGGADAAPQEGQRIEANWKGYGEFYPGEVKEANSDGSFDISYDDGWVEKDVKASGVHPDPNAPKVAPPSEDPACQLQEDIEEVKKRIASAFDEIGKFLLGARADTQKEEDKPKPAPRLLPAAAPAGAPAGAPMTVEPPNDTLKALWAELAELDKEVAALLREVSDADEELARELEKDAGGPSTELSVEDQLADVRDKIKRRERQIARLKDRRERQDIELARLKPVSLNAIRELSKAIDADLERLRRKRDRMAKGGELDPELQHAIDELLKMGSKLADKVAALVAAQEEAEAKVAAGEDPEEANNKVLAAAMDVEKDLLDAKEGARQLDQGVHPHGDKWWRYRYEHAYMEAFLMVIISVFMLVWERLYYYLRHKMHEQAPDHTEPLHETHGTMYIIWLEFACGELMVCLLVFLTVWVIAQIGLWDYFKFLFVGGTDGLHVPHHGREYRHLALDICTVLFFAVLFYFLLVLSIVHAATRQGAKWEELENQSRQSGSGGSRASGIHNVEYATLKNYFLTEVKGRADVMAQIKEAGLEKKFNPGFPLYMYLRLVLRDNIDHIFKFGAWVWMAIVATFVGFMFLHRYQRMGYIRIMSTFLVVLGVVLVIMYYYVRTIGAKLQRIGEKTADGNQPEDTYRSIHQKYSTEWGMLLVLHYVLFFLCYGAARFMCQKWMWQLHFWPVLILACGIVFFSVLFAMFIAPMIPLFTGVLAIPPYVDPHNVALIIKVLDQSEAVAA